MESVLISTDQAHEDSVRLYERGQKSQAKKQMASLRAKLQQSYQELKDTKIQKKLEALEMEEKELERAEQDATYRQRYLKKR